MPAIRDRLFTGFLFLILAIVGQPVASQEGDYEEGWLTRQHDDGQAILVTIFYESPSSEKDATPAELASRAQQTIREAIATSLIEVVHTYHGIPALTAWIPLVFFEDLIHTSDGSRLMNLSAGAWLTISPERSGEGVPPVSSSSGSAALTDSRDIVNVNELHSMGIKGAGRRIAILDTGVDLANADFAGRVVAQACFCFNPSANCCPNGQATQFGAGSAQDDNGHGTHVAGIAAASATSTGIAPDAEIVAVKTIDSNNSFWAFSDQTAALDWLFSQNLALDVVNMSLGTFASFSGICDSQASFLQAARQAIANLNSQGTVVVVSAMNSSTVNRLPAPACLSNTVAVGATDNSDVAAGFSNSSPLVDLFAPGVNIVASRLGGGTTAFSGTSMSAPHVAAGVAILTGVFQSGSNFDVVESLIATGVIVSDSNGNSAPRIDLLAAYGNLFATDFIAIPPRIDSVEVTDGSIFVSFTPETEPETGVPGTFEFVATCTDGTDVFASTGNESPIAIAGAVPGREYLCTVAAVSGVGQSIASNSVPIIIGGSAEIGVATGLPIWLLYAADNPPPK